MRVPKLRKDGTPKRSGLCEGDRRVARTLQFKLQVVEEYRSLQQGKAEGRCRAPIREVAERFGIHTSLLPPVHNVVGLTSYLEMRLKRSE